MLNYKLSRIKELLIYSSILHGNVINTKIVFKFIHLKEVIFHEYLNKNYDINYENFEQNRP